MNHLAFILAAYGAATFGIIALTIAIIWRGRILSRKIALLEAVDPRRQKNKKPLSASLQDDQP
ncbi:heme exporter protein CcmD [Bartonella sp. HY406]|uniref:heme exporter protein CcmD n=1 Tax=Bartonella sp. HY406 TaxID=2979331 RepID=UPI0021C8A03D|nr:heme exporter protein CcmD [Bartonella sp. HY406]UXN03218.1 heme exporter protein CcmD [Bartonella sp. HY406]